MNNNNCCQSMGHRYERQTCNQSSGMSVFPEKVSVAMAYVPFQTDSEVYTCEKALKQGTVFPALDKPFTMGCMGC